MVILGIDPGFSFTGYGLLKKDGLRVILLDYGYLKLNPKDTLSCRVGHFYDFFSKKIQENSVTAISLETSFLGKNAQNFLKLGYLRGILYLLASQYNLQLLEYAPKEVKMSVTGFGGASKEQVARAVMQLFPRLQHQEKNDVTDALAVTLCGLWNSRYNLNNLR